MQVERYAAFSNDPSGGNPAGVVLDAAGMTASDMLATAAAVGDSETAFLLPRPDGEFDIRYFSPLAEVPFCGHATIATGAANAARQAGIGGSTSHTMVLHAMSGRVEVTTAVEEGATTATLVSVPPTVAPIEPAELHELLAALRWAADDLDPALPPRVASAGARHPVIAAATRDRLARLDYDFASLAALMSRCDWTTIDLVWRAGPHEFVARNPFPPGGIVEDPATGAAAAALGGYLRELGLVDVPATITVRQGDDMGRPSTITVGIPQGTGGISVTGSAVRLPEGHEPTGGATTLPAPL